MDKKYKWKMATWLATLFLFGIIEFVVLYIFGDYQPGKLGLVVITVLAGFVYLFISIAGLLSVILLSKKFPDLSDESPMVYLAMLMICAIITNFIWLTAVYFLGVKTDLGLFGSIFLSFFNMGASIGTYLSIDRTMSAVP